MTPNKTKIFAILYKISCVFCALSLLALALISVTEVARSLTLVDVSNDDGIPSNWGLTSSSKPDEITVGITYFDQNYDCENVGSGARQFEFGQCNDRQGGGLQQGIVKNHLGSDGLPIPSYKIVADAKNAGIDYRSSGVVGNDPVESTDAFYRWFHAVEGKSRKFEREITFSRVGDRNEYDYGGRQIFPLDDVVPAGQELLNHNFHFTAHTRIPIKVSLSGDEVFDFTGDDDVWVFLNNELVLDIGGVHAAIDGTFTINENGTVSSIVNNSIESTHNLGLKEGQVVNLDFFYAERNTTEANTRITISNMEWPITADAELTASVVSNKVQYIAEVENRDTSKSTQIEKLSSFLTDNEENNSGFIPLSNETLEYSYDLSSDEWQKVEINMPATSSDGFVLNSPIALAPSGENSDKVYFRYAIKPEKNDIDYSNIITFYTVDAEGYSGITYAKTRNVVSGIDTSEPTTSGGSSSNEPNPDETINDTAVSEGDLGFPEIPDTGVLGKLYSTPFGNQILTKVVLSEQFILVTLAVFFVSFIGVIRLRKYRHLS